MCGICSDLVVLPKPKFGRPCTAPILAKTSRSESSKLSRFVTNLTGKPFDESVPEEWKRHQLAHTAAENMSYTPSWPGLPVLKAVHSNFVTNLAGKPFNNSVPDKWKRHQLAHTAAENISYTPILARASSSESSTLSRFVTNLAGKPFDTLSGKDTNLLTPQWKTCCIHPSWLGLPVLKAVHSQVLSQT